ncbi:MAG: ribonuclease H-like domain-containing protein [Myxococcales bacterium]|nr:ribonuclease H-like domain-containing protein [Myxococcales bacterium]
MLTLRFPLAPGGARAPLLGGALGRLHLPTATRWSAIDRVLSAAASTVEGGGAPMIALDTETTGVSTNAGTIAFLIGVAFFEAEALVVEQWLLHRLAAEAAMLRALAAALDARCGPASALVTFNGASFDLPLLRTRFARAGLSPAFLGARHLDLLLPARRLWQGEGPDCRLTTLERRHLGVVRRDDVEGHAIPPAFWRWIEAPQERAAAALIDRVCAHNQVDLITLPALAEVIAATLEGPRSLAEALRVARLEHGRGEDARAVEVLGPWLPALDELDALAVDGAPTPARADGGAEERAAQRREGEDARAAEPPVRAVAARGVHTPTGRHALGGVRERMARLGIGAGPGPRALPQVRRIRADGERGERGEGDPVVDPPAALRGEARSEPPTATASRPPGEGTRGARASAERPMAPPAVLREAWAMAARALRRLGEDRRAAGLWAAICRAAPGDAEAHEALAKLLEHRLGDLPRALAVTLASSAPSPRRLARLRRKLAKHSHGAAESVYG